MSSLLAMPNTKDSAINEWDIEKNCDGQDDPLLSCLVHLVKIHHKMVSQSALCAGLPLVNNKLTVSLFARAAKRAKMSSVLRKRAIPSISSLEMPAILLLHGRRACILIESDHEKQLVTILSPETGMGKEQLSFDDIISSYSGYAFFLRPSYEPEQLDATTPRGRNKNWFWSAIFESWRVYRDVLLASFLISLLGLASPFFVLNVYDRVIPNNAIETLWVLALGIGIVHVFSFLAKTIRGYFIDMAGKQVNLKVSARLLEKVMGLRMEVRPQSVGGFSRQLQQFESVREFITSFTVTTLIDLPFAGIAMLAVWYLAGSVVYILLIAVFFLLAFALCVQPSLRRVVEKTFAASAQKNAILVEGLSGIETIKFLGAESQIQQAWEEAVSYIAEWSAKSRFLSQSVTNVSSAIQAMANVAVVVAGVYLIAEGKMSQGGLIACVILSRMAIAPMAQVVNLITRYYRAKMALATLNAIMELPVDRPLDKHFLSRGVFMGAVCLKNISFSYPGHPNNVLENVNITIKPGEKVALIGTIGSGKTTLGKLILGLFEPTAGMITMDDTDIRQIDPAELRRCIGYVPQDVVLFRGTMRDNLTLGVRAVDDSSILRVSEVTGVSQIIKSHAKGYDMDIGERGQGLSGGQRQNVALARALLLDPPVLLMDEPTSSMDHQTENTLLKHLSRVIENKTMIVITHRSSLLKLVDRVIVLKEGKVVADGARDRVLESLQKGQIQL